MNNNKYDTPRRGRFARVLVSVAAVVAALWYAPPVAQATDPIPDVTVLVCPVLCPKSGHPMRPTDVTEDWVRNAYGVHYEGFWKECSHWTANSNGVTTHGVYEQTKTLNYVHLPWPLAAPDASLALTGYLSEGPAGYTKFNSLIDPSWFKSARAKQEPNGEIDPVSGLPVQLYVPGPPAPLLDGVWTPGEAFFDQNGDGVWNDTVKDEDRWVAGNKVAIWWQDSPGSWTRGGFESRLPDTQWDDRRGEIYADYHSNTTFDAKSGVALNYGFDPVVVFGYVRPGESSNVFITVSELDLSPFNGVATYEGDMLHTYKPGDPGDKADVAKNNNFDFNWEPFNNYPVVYRALKIGTTNPLAITYSVYIDPATEQPYVGTDPGGAGAILTPQSVALFQASELFGAKDAGAPPGVNDYFDTIFPQYGKWDAGKKAEPFEDFLSWWHPLKTLPRAPKGGFTYVAGGIPGAIDHDGAVIGYTALGAAIPAGRTGRGDRTVPITYQQYVDYINWNYPVGVPDSRGTLIALAGNGKYDGPDGFIECANNKYRQRDWLEPDMFIALDPNDKWVTTPYATWQAWYAAVLGATPALVPAWPGTIPDLTEENPGTNLSFTFTVVTNMVPGVGEVVSSNANGAWMPALNESWAYDSAREFYDTPSAIYHSSGDGRLGEITSPKDSSIYGQDLGEGSPFTTAPFDYMYQGCGPGAWGVHGLNGFDAGNVLTLEVLTRQTTNCGAGFLARCRDANLDGMIDQGETRRGYPSYTIDDNQLSVDDGCDQLGPTHSNYPMARRRLFEDVVEAYDYIQNYTDIKGIPYLAVLHYPGGGGFKYVSGAFVSCNTMDGVFGSLGQCVNMAGGGEGGEAGTIATNRPDPQTDGGFGQGIIAHEMSHDLWGMPDLYDYDKWNGIIANYPVGGYDLMSEGGLVHGVSSTVIGRGWSSAQNLKNILTLNGGPKVIDMYPSEWSTNTFYLFSRAGGSTAEILYFWYIGGDSFYDPVGGRGVYVFHQYTGGTGQFPLQQRLGEHFVYEVLQADGLGQLQDGVNTGDGGDPFPGTSGKTTFNADTIPNSRWWDKTDSGIRILNIELPPVGSRSPAKVTFEWYDPSVVVRSTADTDGDGLPDWWESLYGLNPNDASGVNGKHGDPDGDGLSNYAEFQAQTDPKKFDTDGNGIGDYDSKETPVSRTYGERFTDGDSIDDAWEEQYPTACNSLVYDANLDPDEDGWDNLSEYLARTDPSDPASYPVPALTFTVRYEGTKRDGDLVVFAYDNALMDGEPKVGYKPAGGDLLGILGEDLGVTGAATLTGTLTNQPVFPGSVMIAGGTASFADNGAGQLIGTLAGSSGTIDYDTGAWTLTFLTPPAAGTPITANYAFIDNSTVTYPGRVVAGDPDFGHLRQGQYWFHAFLDLNNDSTWQEGEPFGLATGHPITIGQGAVEIELSLTDTLPGYGRFSWEPTDAGTYSISVRRQNTTGQPIVFTREVKAVLNLPMEGTRTYIHEGDFMNAGLYGLPSGGLQEPAFEWFVDNISGGVFTNHWGLTLPAPTPVRPVGGYVVLSKMELEWAASETNTQFYVQVSTAPNGGGALLVNQIIPSPHRNLQGHYKYTLPIYGGDGSFVNGVYYWRVQAINPTATSPWSSSASFALNLQDTASGSYSVSGTTYYYGALAGTFPVVLQAFTSSGFSGTPVVQKTYAVVGAYKLLGLPAGNYYVRAFIDQDGDRQLDSYESWGMVKSTTSAFASSYSSGIMTLPPSATIRDVVIRDRDNDNDRLPDGWEMWQFGSLESSGPGPVPGSDAYTDADSDGLNDYEELAYGADPHNPDTDGDGLKDGEEHLVYHTLAANADSDGDGLNDGYEARYGLNPISAYDDNSGLPTNIKLMWDGVAGYNPATDLTPGQDDSDHDGVTDIMEIAAGSNPLDPASKKSVEIKEIRVNSDGHAVVVWDMCSNSRGIAIAFTVEYTENLVDWTMVGTWVSSGTADSTATVLDTVHHTGTGFYRLRLKLVE